MMEDVKENHVFQFLGHNVRSAHNQPISAPKAGLNGKHPKKYSKLFPKTVITLLHHCSRHLGMPNRMIRPALGITTPLRFCRVGQQINLWIVAGDWSWQEAGEERQSDGPYELKLRDLVPVQAGQSPGFTPPPAGAGSVYSWLPGNTGNEGSRLPSSPRLSSPHGLCHPHCLTVS